MQFDFGDGSGEGADGEMPDFSEQEPLGNCPKCGSRVFELPAAYVCEKAVGPEKTCDFRSGRVILQRPIEREQMQKLLSSGKTALLQFISSRTRRPFAAYLVRQPDGKVGFEFEAKKDGKGRPSRGGAALRVLGPHPKDKQPVELHAGRYGPYVKHGAVNATLPDRDRIDTLTLDEAVGLLAAKAGSARTTRAKPAKGAVTRGVPKKGLSTKVSKPAAVKATKLAKTGEANKAARTSLAKRATKVAKSVKAIEPVMAAPKTKARPAARKRSP